MSNSIWHKASEKPKSFSFILEHHKAYDFDNHKVITAYNIFETGGNPQNPFDESTIRWCYLDDLITKAERLEQAVKYLKRLHIKTIEKYNPKEKELAEQTIDYAIEMAIEHKE